jgi:hypothetical protein
MGAEEETTEDAEDTERKKTSICTAVSSGSDSRQDAGGTKRATSAAFDGWARQAAQRQFVHGGSVLQGRHYAFHAQTNRRSR